MVHQHLTHCLGMCAPRGKGGCNSAALACIPLNFELDAKLLAL